MDPRDIRFPTYTPPPPPESKALLGWWGMGSIAAGLVAAACLPAAVMGRENWVTQLSEVTPVWSMCCIAGVGLGIRGMQKQRKSTKLKWGIALAGLLLSLFTFMTLTLIVVFVSA